MAATGVPACWHAPLPHATRTRRIALAIIRHPGRICRLSADTAPDHAASNTGTFLVYGMTNALVCSPSRAAPQECPQARDIRWRFAGQPRNAGAVIVMSVSAGGSTQTDTLIALGAVVVWIVIGAIWLVFNRRDPTACWSTQDGGPGR